MYLFSLVHYFLCCLCILNVFAEHKEQTNDKCTDSCNLKCQRGQIPEFCTNSVSKNKTCVPDNRPGMEHGWWEVDYNKGYRCILRCEEGFIQDGCHVQRTWIEKMPTCIEDTWSRFAKTAGINTLKGAGVVGAGVAVGAGAVAAVVPVLGVLGFGSAGVVAGSFAASIQTATTAAGSVFAWAQSVGAVGYVGTTGTAVIGGGAGSLTTAVTGKLTAAFTGCESE